MVEHSLILLPLDAPKAQDGTSLGLLVPRSDHLLIDTQPFPRNMISTHPDLHMASTGYFKSSSRMCTHHYRFIDSYMVGDRYDQLRRKHWCGQSTFVPVPALLTERR